jgi:hypothetical protein
MPHDLGVQQPTSVDDAQRVHRGVDRGEVLGGLLMIAVTAAPSVADGFTAGGDGSVGVRVTCASLQVLALLLMALLAPLVGWRRRDMWWALLPIWASVIAYRLGVGLVRRGRGEGVSERFPRL